MKISSHQRYKFLKAKASSYASIEKEHRNACEMFHAVDSEFKSDWEKKADGLEVQMTQEFNAFKQGCGSALVDPIEFIGLWCDGHKQAFMSQVDSVCAALG